MIPRQRLTLGYWKLVLKSYERQIVSVIKWRDSFEKKGKYCKQFKVIGWLIIMPLHLALNEKKIVGGVHGRVADLESLTSQGCEFESHQGLWILSCEEAFQLAYRTSVVLLRCSLLPEIMPKGAPKVFLHQWKAPYDLRVFI